MFFQKLLDSAEKLTLVFYEPIGWQRFKGLSRFAVKTYFNEFCNLIPSEKWIGQDPTFKLSDELFHENAVTWSVIHRYNLNLLNQISDLVDNRRMQLVQADYDIFGSNPVHPMSLFILKKMG